MTISAYHASQRQRNSALQRGEPASDVDESAGQPSLVVRELTLHHLQSRSRLEKPGMNEHVHGHPARESGRTRQGRSMSGQ